MSAWIGNHIGLIEMSLSAAVPLGFCAWQYVTLRRSLREMERTSADASPAEMSSAEAPLGDAPSAGETGHPKG